MSDAPRRFSLESRVWIPRLVIISAALSVGAASFCNIVFKDVPASLPTIPASANFPNTAVVSCMLHPALYACADTCASPCVNGSTSVDDDAAAPAKAFAANADSSAESPNAPIA